MNCAATRVMKAAVFGCGKIGWEFQDDPGAAAFGICTHAAAWAAIEGVALAAVSDADPARARRCAERWQAPISSASLAAMLDEARPDIVSIATPDDQHHAAVKACLEFSSVRAVLAEKPLAMTLTEAEELDMLARQHGKTLVVNYSRRFCPFYDSLRRRVQSGEFGALRLARNLYTKGARHNGSHFLDLMRFLAGPFQPVGASLPKWLSHDPRDSDPGLDVQLTAPGGASIVMHHVPANQFTVFEMDLCFERARFVCTEGGDSVLEFGLAADVPFAGYTSLAIVADHRHVMRDYLLHAAQHVVAVLRDGVTNVSPASESVALMRDYAKIAALLP